MHVVWFIPEEHLTAANAILDQLGRGPLNFRRKAIDPATGGAWWWTADEPGQEFMDLIADAEAGKMGPEVKTVIVSAQVFVSPDPALPEDERTSLTGLAHIRHAFESLGFEEVPEGQE